MKNKKIIVILVLILVLVLSLNKKEYNLTNDAIRFRVIANSNSLNDILIKEKVVNKLSTIVFKKNNKEETRKNIINNLSTIENEIKDLFRENNYDKNFNISYGMNMFPEKVYRNVTYPSGLYESLVIEIGEAKGDNYWCFLYPALCMLENNKTEKIKYKFKISELFHKIF